MLKCFVTYLFALIALIISSNSYFYLINIVNYIVKMINLHRFKYL